MSVPTPPPAERELRMAAAWARATRARVRRRRLIRAALAVFGVQVFILGWDMFSGAVSGWDAALAGTAYWWLGCALLSDAVCVALILVITWMHEDIVVPAEDGFYAEAVAREIGGWETEYWRDLYYQRMSGPRRAAGESDERMHDPELGGPGAGHPG